MRAFGSAWHAPPGLRAPSDGSGHRAPCPQHEQEQEGIIKSMTKTREKWKYDTGKVMAHDI